MTGTITNGPRVALLYSHRQFPLAVAGLAPTVILFELSELPERTKVRTVMSPKISMESATQLAIFLSNRPGALARVCEALAKADINIHALAISDTVDHSVVRMVVSDPTQALMLLGEAGVLALENEVVLIEADNTPGMLAKIAERLAKAKVNIEYMYLAANVKADR